MPPRLLQPHLRRVAYMASRHRMDQRVFFRSRDLAPAEACLDRLRRLSPPPLHSRRLPARERSPVRRTSVMDDEAKTIPGHLYLQARPKSGFCDLARTMRFGSDFPTIEIESK